MSYLTGTAFPLNVQVNGLTNSGVLIVELASTGEQLTFTAAGTDSFSGYYDTNQIYTLNIILQPATAPTQTCVIANPNLNLTFATTTFVVNCAENWYKVNVAVTGIDTSNNTDLEILNNGTELKLTQTNGTVSFDVGDGLPYDIITGAVPTVPSTHVCQLIGTTSGTISGADVSMKLSCLSLMKTSFASGAFMPSTKAMVFTFSGPVTGCVLDSTAGGPPYRAGTANGSPGVTYAGKTAVIAPTSLPWSFSAATLPQQIMFRLTGCLNSTDASLAANNGNPLAVTVKMMDGEVYFVSDASGSDTNGCMDPSNSCKTIQTAVNYCSSSNVCTVMVEGGTYIIIGTTSPISISSSGGIRLMGSFDPTFNTQSLDFTPSAIIDRRSNILCAGTTLGTNECAPITITASGMANDTNKIHIVQGFTIVADETKKNAFGVRILNGDNTSFSYLFGNYITGGEGGLGTENSATGGVRGGIYLQGAKSQNQIDTNVIKGGFGADASVAVYNYDSNLYLFHNRLSGDKAVSSSASLDSTSYNDPAMAILNNTMNYRQYTDGSVTAVSVYGIRNFEDSPNTQLYIAGNTIYSSGAAGGSNYGIFMSGTTNAQMLNNLIKGPGSNSVCASFSVTPSSTAIFTGNNLDCSLGKLVTVGATNYPYYCSNGTFNSFSALCILANAFLDATRGGQNFTNVPSFNTAPVGQPWLSLQPVNGGPCNIAFGGVETSTYIGGTFDPYYKLDAVISAPVPRTASFGGNTPSGSSGYTIGAFELDDSGCAP